MWQVYSRWRYEELISLHCSVVTFAEIFSNNLESCEEGRKLVHALSIGKLSHYIIKWYFQYQTVSHNYGQRKTRNLSGVHENACFSLLGAVAASLVEGWGGSVRRSGDAWAGRKTLIGSLLPLLGKSLLSKSLALPESTHKNALLSGGSLEFIKSWGSVYQVMLLTLRTGLQSTTKYSPPNWWQRTWSSFSPTNKYFSLVFILYLSVA